MLAFKVCHFLTNETESKPAGVWKQYRAWGTSLPGWGATLTAWLTLTVGVRVGRRGWRGYGAIAMRLLLLLLLRAVLVSTGNGVVGGRSVLKERFAAHHLRRSIECGSLQSTWENSASEVESGRWYVRSPAEKQRKDAAPKWNLVPLHAPSLSPAHSNQVFSQRLAVRQEWAESARECLTELHFQPPAWSSGTDAAVLRHRIAPKLDWKSGALFSLFLSGLSQEKNHVM